MARSLRPRPPPRATRRSLPGIELVARYLDAIYLPVRPTGTKEGVLCAWGIDNGGRRVLIDVCLGMRESEQDWLELGRGLTARGWRLLAGRVASTGAQLARSHLAPSERQAILAGHTCSGLR
jgi:transposase-like protein